MDCCELGQAESPARELRFMPRLRTCFWEGSPLRERCVKIPLIGLGLGLNARALAQRVGSRVPFPALKTIATKIDS